MSGTDFALPTAALEPAPKPPAVMVMVDLETLGTEPGCAVVAIGAVQFALQGPGPIIRSEFKRTVTLTSCARAGLTINAPTLEWWLTQPYEAITSTFAGERTDVWSACKDFTRWVRELGAPDAPLQLWAKPPQFDQKILEAACAAVGTPVPWGHRDWRDLRTLEDVAAQAGYKLPDTQPALAHDALEDARAQAYNAAKRLLYLQSKVPKP